MINKFYEKNQKKKMLYEMIRMREVGLRISSEYTKEEMRPNPSFCWSRGTLLLFQII